jgi:MerR family mercuric resistance operon transcriptional regulator
MSDNRVMIGQVATQTSCKVETIRFYEKEGLLPEPDRTAGVGRLYTAALVDRLAFIRRCRELGFSMGEIRGLLSLVDRQQVSCERVKSIADSHLSDIQSRIRDLRKMQRTLQHLSEQCSGDGTPDCPIIDALQSH